jgi:hypothetical protein
MVWCVVVPVLFGGDCDEVANPDYRGQAVPWLTPGLDTGAPAGPSGPGAGPGPAPGRDPAVCSDDGRFQPYGDIQIDGQCQVACLYEFIPEAVAEYQAACELYASVALATTNGPLRPCPACP